jgi:FkbM family methyltransferase
MTSEVRTRIIDGLVGLMPGKAHILKAAARLPPSLRSPQSSRVFQALARRTAVKTRTLSSNMGIARHLLCEMPATQMLALYGTPALYVGERASLELAARLSHFSDAFVDIGAHLGYFTFYVTLRGAQGLPVHYFEPDPVLYAGLNRNVGANRLDRVHGHNIAIGATDGTARFYVNRTDALSGSLTRDFANQHEVTATDVEVQRFSTAADRLGFNRACVKVDVEGAEWDFMEGAASALGRISYLIMEVLRPAHDRRFVQTLMARGGFHAYYVNDYTLEHSVDGAFEYREPEYNWLFCREQPSELAAKIGTPPLSVRF